MTCGEYAALHESKRVGIVVATCDRERWHTGRHRGPLTWPPVEALARSTQPTTQQENRHHVVAMRL